MSERKQDEPLRRDVHFLGALLGEILKEQAGTKLFETEELVRTLAIERRRGPLRLRSAAEEKLTRALSSLSVPDAERVIRAFSIYFQLANIAEQHHRIRRRRAHALDRRPQRGSLEETLATARTSGVSAQAMRDTLSKLEVTLTFTAHPTQAMRRTVLEKLDRIFERLELRDRAQLTPQEADDNLEELRDEVRSLWQTDEVRRDRPTVGDEVKNLTWYLEEILWELVAALPRRLEDVFDQVYGEPLGLRCSPLRIHSWIGGDMDGNPNVTPEVLEDAIRAYQTRGLRKLLAEVVAVGGLLSGSGRYLVVPTELRASIHRDEVDFGEPDAPDDSEPWRRKLRFMERRLEATLHDAEARRSWAMTLKGDPPPLTSYAFRSPRALEADLEMIVRSLESAGAAGRVEARSLLEKVRALGFQLAELEIRVPAEDVRDAANGNPQTDGGKRVVAALERIARVQQEVGEACCRTLILSMALSAEDVLAALQCARRAGLWNKERNAATVDVVPLCETLDALNDSPRILTELFAHPAYGPHLRARGVQEVMIGYSDSGKEVGLMAARAALLRAQSELPRIAREAGVALRIFHGRGESVARGGGPAQQAIMALPRGSVAGRYKATEQGEAMDHKYARPELAMRNAELVLGGVLLHTLGLEPHPADSEEARFREVLNVLGEEGRKRYRKLVWEDDRFLELFNSATPLDEISLLPIGSRPAKRKKGGLESLRAIPWVFAWTQNRAILPGWFGLGTALAAVGGKAKGRAALRRMYADWPYFRTVIDGVAMVLAKSDMDIAARYVHRLSPREVWPLWKQVEDEFELTQKWVAKVTGRKKLLENNPSLERSIALRNPYVDPMSFLQIELLARKRQGDEATHRPLLLTLAGISQGLRNTG